MNLRSLSPLLVFVLVGCSGLAPVEGGDVGGGGTSTASGPGSGAGPDGGGGGTTTSTGGSGGDAPVARTTRTALEANDTSASSAFVDSYTPATRFNGSATPVSNGDAPPGAIPATTLAAGRVSKVDVHTLVGDLPVFVEMQSWFCTNGMTPIGTDATRDQCKSHIDVGYASDAAAQVKKQVADMRSRGIDGAIVDWQGQGAAVNVAALTLFKDEAEASDGTFRFAAIEDEGIKACAAKPDCDVSQALVDDIDFLGSHFFDSPAYLKKDGRPVLFFFSVDTWARNEGKTIDWSFVRAHVESSPLFVFENAGGFTHAKSDGAYSWLHTTDVGDYPGSDPFGLSGFLPYFYQQRENHDAMIAWGSAWKGFDDAIVNGWGGGRRYTGQQCGKTFLETMAAAKAEAAHLDGVQIATWDDYEEGSETETGIDNHLAISGVVEDGTLTFALAAEAGAPKDCTDAITAGLDLGDTVDHFEVYATANGEDLELVNGALPASVRSLKLGDSVPANATSLVVYAVGKPMIHDHLSPSIPLALP